MGSGIKLAHTANAPIHNFTHSLSLLLGQLDAVGSYANADVRGRRKEVVQRVEGALQDVERVVDEKERLLRRASQESLKKAVTTDDEKEKKEAAKEWLATQAFKSESSVSTVVEPGVAGAESLPSLAETKDVIESSDSDTSTIQGYDIVNDGETVTSSLGDARVSSPHEVTSASSAADVGVAQVSQQKLIASRCRNISLVEQTDLENWRPHSHLNLIRIPVLPEVLWKHKIDLLLNSADSPSKQHDVAFVDEGSD
jgi:hypothetical protein